MKRKSQDGDFVENPQSILENKMKTCKQPISNTNSFVKIPSKLVQNPKKPVVTAKNINDLKNQEQSSHVTDSTPKKVVPDSISIGSDRNLITPFKINPEFYDTTYLSNFEVVSMQHELDDMLDWKHMRLQTDSILDYTSPDAILRVLDSEIKPEKDPLFIENEHKDRKWGKELSQSPCRKSDHKSNSQKSNKKRRVSFAKNAPKSQYKPTKSNKKSVPAEETMEIKVEKIFEDVHYVEKGEILSSQIIEKLQNLKVRLTHEVPPQHKIENNAGSRAPTQLQKKIFEKHHTIIKGKFSEEEDSIIKKNWISFCKIHKWDERNIQPFMYMRHQGTCYISSITERQKFVQFLANGLPGRTLYSVYFRFKSLFGIKFHQTKGRFSTEEDEKIKFYMKGATDSNKKFTQLAKILGRTRQSVWLRYQVLKKDTTPKRKKKENQCLTEVTWTVSLIEEFVQQLMDVTLTEDVKELKYAVIPKVVWEEMESRMHINHKLLKVFWLQQLHVQLFSPVPIYLNDVKIKLIEFLHKSGISHPKEINWPDICSLFDGLTTAFLCRVFYGILKYVGRKNNSMTFVEILEYLHNEMVPTLKNRLKDRFLPRISFDDETIRIVDTYEEVPTRKCERLNSSSENEVEHKKNSVSWTLPMREKFLKTLLDVTLCKHVDELKDTIIPKVVWEEVAERMSADVNRLIELWYKEMHMQLFSPIPIYMNDIKIKLIELIYREQIKELDLIKWPKVCKYFDGMTTYFISDVFLDLVNSAQGEFDSDNFCDIMEYLFKTLISKLKNQPTDNFLPRLSFKNKTLSIIVDEFQKSVLKEERRSICSNTSNEEPEENPHTIWTIPMREKFIKKLLIVTLSTDVNELKDAIIPEVVWNEMEMEMEMDQKILKELWYYELHMQLFSPDQIFMNDIKIKLIEYFYRENITDLKKILWPKVCKYFVGFTTFFLSKIFYNLINSASTEINSIELSDILEYLYTKKIPSLTNKATDMALPRLSYERRFINIITKSIKAED